MPVTYMGKLPVKIKRVFFTGTTALVQGAALCYDADRGTAASEDQNRYVYVEKPSTSNNYNFAGVTTQAYVANSAGQWVEIYEPGSPAIIYASGVSATANATFLTACAGQHYFTTAGFRGRGTARALQTVDTSETAGYIMALLDDGEESGLVELLTPTAGADTAMVGGVTHLVAATLASNATYTLADGTFTGQRKAFIGAVMATSDCVITVTTPVPVGGYGFTDPAATYNTYTIDAAAEHLHAEWNGKAWMCTGTVGTAA